MENNTQDTAGSQAYETRGTVERAKGFPVKEPSDFGIWNEEGCQNPIHYAIEQAGRNQTVVFDLAIAHYDNIGEGPITLTAHLEVTSCAGEPDETLVDRLVLFVSGVGKQVLSRETAMFERFAGAALKIAAVHFNRYEWDAACRAEEEARQEDDRFEYGRAV